MKEQNVFIRIIEGEFEGEVGSIIQENENAVIAFFSTIQQDLIILHDSAFEIVSQ